MPVSAASAPDGEFRSLEYGLGLLRLFTVAKPERGVGELARELNVSAPTAHRYAATCLELGYLEQGATRRYRLAARSAEPGMALLSSLRLSRCARAILRELRAHTGRTVALAILDGAQVVYLQRLCGWQRGQYRLEKGLGTGSRVPAGETAAGIALRAAGIALQTAEAEAGPEAGPEAGAEEAEAEAETEEQEEEEEGQEGLECEMGPTFAERERESREGARTLAIAVRTPPGEPTGAIEIVVPARELSEGEMFEELGEPLHAAGVALREALGGGRTVAYAREPAAAEAAG